MWKLNNLALPVRAKVLKIRSEILAGDRPYLTVKMGNSHV